MGESMVDGIWTYLVPQTKTGGVLVIRDAKVAGGNSAYLCTGTFTQKDDAVHMALTFELYNSYDSFGADWGDDAKRFNVVVEGGSIGDIINGRLRRTDVALDLEIAMIRQGDLP